MADQDSRSTQHTDEEPPATEVQGPQGPLPVRRRPDMVRFLATGAILGFLIGAVISYVGPEVPTSSLLQQIILLGIIGGLLGAFLASVVYLVVDRRSTREV
ncbi:hypothetical protein ACQBAT_13380 [Ornithinimicrobium sp. Y1847]|uniref:hypothetical protein n=1 Tax=unclassified Ornithinimicrobium TaxID=2615080 RepID=UPI003B670875